MCFKNVKNVFSKMRENFGCQCLFSFQNMESSICELERFSIVLKGNLRDFLSSPAPFLDANAYFRKKALASPFQNRFERFCPQFVNQISLSSLRVEKNGHACKGLSTPEKSIRTPCWSPNTSHSPKYVIDFGTQWHPKKNNFPPSF